MGGKNRSSTCFSCSQAVLYDYQLCMLSGHPKVPQVKCLYSFIGVTFDQHLAWKVHITSLCSGTNPVKAFYKLRIVSFFLLIAHAVY